MTNDINKICVNDKTIRELFAAQASHHCQKVAVALDEQSLTYAELLFYTHKLTSILTSAHAVKVGDIICQCVERSISMVSKY